MIVSHSHKPYSKGIVKKKELIHYCFQKRGKSVDGDVGLQT